MIGKPAIVRSEPKFTILVASLDTAIVRPNDPKLGTAFFYCLFRTDDFQSHVYGYTTGTTVLHLNKEGIPTYKFVKPAGEVGEIFEQSATAFLTRIDTNELQSRTLTATRDALLPKLLSGEVRVREAEKMIEEMM